MFDIIVLAVVGVAALFGLWKGLVRQVVGLLGVAAGYVAAMKFSGPLAAKFLTGFSPATGHVISFFAIFIACVIASSIFGSIMGKLVGGTGLGILNKVGGGLLGGLKGCLVIAVATMLLIAFLPPNTGVLKGSRTMKYIQPMADMISKVAPASIRITYEEKAAKMGRGSGKRK